MDFFVKNFKDLFASIICFFYEVKKKAANNFFTVKTNSLFFNTQYLFASLDNVSLDCNICTYKYI